MLWLRLLITAIIARKEITILLLMLAAIPIAICWKTSDAWDASRGQAHQKLANQLLTSGPDLVVFQIDPSYTARYDSQIQNPVVLTNYKNYIVVHGSPHFKGTTDILDVQLEPFDGFPAPNLVLRTSISGTVYNRYYYIFQGSDAIEKANDFLSVYADERLSAYSIRSNPSSQTGVVGYSWKTRMSLNGPVIFAKMWWKDRYYINTCENIDGNESYILLQNSHKNYEQRILPTNVIMREVR